MKKIIITITLLLSQKIYGESQSQPVINLSSEKGVVIRLYQELTAIQELAKEAEYAKKSQPKNFNYIDFNNAVEILKQELLKANNSNRLSSE